MALTVPLSAFAPPHDETRALMVEAGLVFARMEFALIAAGFYTIRDGRPTRDLRAFATQLSAHFDWASVDAAEAYIRLNPPDHLVPATNMKVEWQTSRAPRRRNLNDLLKTIWQIRNNLVHGSKSVRRRGNLPSRDSDLLQAALVILEACLDCAGHANWRSNLRKVPLRFFEQYS